MLLAPGEGERTAGAAAILRDAAKGDTPGAGQPVQGPAAVRSVVNLARLPQAPEVPRRQPLFRRVGDAALAPQTDGKSTGVGAFVGGLSPLGFGAPTVLLGFNGITSEESGGSGGACGCVPPDGDMSAGPNQVIVAVNQAFRVFNKTGAPLTGPVGFDTFFDGCGTTGLTSSDAITAYDPVANRFTVGILRYNGTTNSDSYVSLAVSQSAGSNRQLEPLLLHANPTRPGSAIRLPSHLCRPGRTLYYRECLPSR